MIGIASPANDQWLSAHGVKAESYGADLADRLREARIDAFIDLHGAGYVKLAVELGVPRDRIERLLRGVSAGGAGR